MTTPHFKRTARASLTSVVVLLLSACGGGDDARPVGNNLTPSALPIALAPLSGGAVYAGTASFGDTVAVELDETAKTVTLRFVDSHFGLTGAIVSPYTTDSNSAYLAKAFTGDASTGLSTKQLAAISLRFTLDNGLLNGSVQQLANLKQGKDALLQGQVTASNRGVTSVASLAGIYSFIQEQASYSDSGAMTQAPSTTYGQISIKADGSFRTCLSQSYSDTCTNTAGTQQVSTTGTLSSEADQARYPGALAMTVNGKPLGRLMVAARPAGQNTLFIDQHEAISSGGFTTGTWLLQPAAMLASTALDGEWLCSQPEVSTSGVATGRMQRNFVSIGQNMLQTDTLDTDIALAAGPKGLLTGQWAGSVPTPARVFMPLGANTVRYVGNTGAGSTPTAAISGTCQALPAPATLPTYLNAVASQVSMVMLGDARPTQPAVGYDQIYYKQGRYRHVATGAVVSTVWQKAFDDLCEDSGQNAAATKSKETAKTDPTLWKLNDRTSFDCTVSDANRVTTGLKSAVVGPHGLLYLTDGHHTFNSLWEAPNNQGQGGIAGPTVKMPVVIQGNYQDLSHAAFWRKMRASNWVWLKAPDGLPVTPVDLPTQLGLSNGLLDDPYRSLVYYTRDVGYTPPANAPEFLEFYWADWLKAAPQNIRLADYNLQTTGAGNDTDKGYMQAIKDASKLIVNAAPATVIDGKSGYTAQTMGALTGNFGTAAYLDLPTPKPMNGKKAGKLAYALEYRASLTAK